jgi:hypothetical protein
MMSSASQSILNEILDFDWVDAPMTPRELDFIEDLNKNRDKALSPRQKAWLDKIWRKVFS